MCYLLLEGIYLIYLFLVGSSGFITYNNVGPGRYTLRIVASTVNNERAIIRRRIYIGMYQLFL